MSQNSLENLVEFLQNRTNEQNQSNIICVHGAKGSGKSFICLRMGELLDPDFGIDRVVFTPTELYRLLQGKPKRGTTIVYEECGTSINAREALSKSNRHFSFINQAWRTKNITVLFNTPLVQFVDKQVRSMFDYEIVPLGYDKERNLSKFKFVKNYPNPGGPEPIHKHLIYDEDGVPVKINGWIVQKPSEKLIEQYEIKRDAYLDGLISDGLASMETGIEQRGGVPIVKQKAKPASILSIIEQVKDDKTCFVDGKASAVLIQDKYGKGINASKEVASFINKQIVGKNTHTTINESII